VNVLIDEKRAEVGDSPLTYIFAESPFSKMEYRLITIGDTHYVRFLKYSNNVTRKKGTLNDHEGHIARMSYSIKKSSDRSLSSCTKCDLVLPL
jgi:hypothetical protein